MAQVLKKISTIRIPLLDRYIVKQLSLFFLFSVGLLTSLGVAIGTVSDLAYKITEYDLPIPVAILVFIYKIPEYLAYGLPISMLLASLVIYGRLQSDRELIAFLSFGINFYRLIVPAIAFSLLITGLTFLLNELIVPAANYQANLLQNPFVTETELNLQKRDVFYPEYEPSRRNSSFKQLRNLYFAERYRDLSLEKVTIIGFDRGKINRVIVAQKAQWNGEQQVWELTEGEVNKISYGIKGIISEQFNSKQLSLPGTIFKIAQKQRSPEDMNIQEAKEYLKLIETSGKKIDIAKFAVRIQQKYAFPFICLVFSLIGSTLGAKYSYINRSKGFGLCVAIVFMYYLLGFLLGSLGITGILTPWLAAWIPNLIGFSIGGWLLVTVYD